MNTSDVRRGLTEQAVRWGAEVVYLPAAWQQDTLLGGMCSMDSPWHMVAVLFLKISPEVTWKTFRWSGMSLQV